MKIAIVVLAVVAAASAQYNPFSAFSTARPGQYNRYNQFPRVTTPSPYRPFVSTTPAPVTYAPPVYAPAPIIKAYNGDARLANTVKSGNEIYPDGSYAYFFETDNGIAAEQQGTPRNFGGNPPVIPDVAQGSYSYTSPNGEPIAISYIADENGYQPTGNAIPTPPPVPALIARALEYLARNAPQK